MADPMPAAAVAAALQAWEEQGQAGTAEEAMDAALRAGLADTLQQMLDAFRAIADARSVEQAEIRRLRALLAQAAPVLAHTSPGWETAGPGLLAQISLHWDEQGWPRCAWCPNPWAPDPASHPGGGAEHVVLPAEVGRG